MWTLLQLSGFGYLSHNHSDRCINSCTQPVKWQGQGASTAEPRSGRPHKLTERNRRVLKRVACKNRLSSVATHSTEFQTDLWKLRQHVRRELHEMRFHGRSAAHKTKITMRYTRCRLEWCKARCHWTLEQYKHVLWSDESRFTIWQSNR
jgi:hypothetical protein